MPRVTICLPHLLVLFHPVLLVLFPTIKYQGHWIVKLSENGVSLKDGAHLLRPKYFWVVVDMAEGSEGMLMLLELCKGIAQGLTLRFSMNWFKVPHHSTL